MAGVVHNPLLHEHALVKKISEEKSSSFFCSFCCTVTTGPSTRYTCDHCDFSLHTFCASCPATVSNPFHEHVLKLVQGYKCILCKKTLTPQSLDYGCDLCSFYVHHSCHHKATVQLASLPKQINYKDHDHPLYLVDVTGDFMCGKCGETGDAWGYMCRSLRTNIFKQHFCLHTYCFEEPKATLQSPLHPEHELKHGSWYVEHTCDSCKEKAEGAFYICKECEHKFVLHPICHQKAAGPDMDDCSTVPDSRLSDVSHDNRAIIKSPWHASPLVDPFYPTNHILWDRDDSRRDEQQQHIDVPNPAVGSKEGMYLFLHPQHDLELTKWGIGKKCEVCDELTAGESYLCLACCFSVHATCSSIKPAVKDVVHPRHILHYLISRPTSCKECNKMCVGWRYKCDLCNVHVHRKCLKGYASPKASASSSSPFLGEVSLI